MTLLRLSDSERNPFKNLMYEEDQPDNLNTIPLIADSTEKKALHVGIYKEFCTYSTYIGEENINNKIV